MVRMRLWGAVAAGGAVGSLGRVGIDVLAADLLDAPGWSALVGRLGPTLLVNVLGAFALAALAHRLQGEVARATVLTGALGAWTTVSTFAVEAAGDVVGGRPLLAASYVVATLAAGVLAAWLGEQTAGWPVAGAATSGHGVVREGAAHEGRAREGVVPGATVPTAATTDREPDR